MPIYIISVLIGIGASSASREIKAECWGFQCVLHAIQKGIYAQTLLRLTRYFCRSRFCRQQFSQDAPSDLSEVQYRSDTGEVAVHRTCNTLPYRNAAWRYGRTRREEGVHPN